MLRITMDYLSTRVEDKQGSHDSVTAVGHNQSLRCRYLSNYLSVTSWEHDIVYQRIRHIQQYPLAVQEMSLINGDAKRVLFVKTWQVGGLYYQIL